MRNVRVIEHTTGETPKYEVEDAETERIIYDRGEIGGTLADVKKFLKAQEYTIVSIALS